MFRSVTVVNDRGEALELDIFNPFTSGMNVIDIDGIGPGKATVNMIELYGKDGSNVNSARLPTRHITISLEFLSAPSVEEVRHRSYRFFPVKREVTLIFRTDTREIYTTGVVESNEPKIFQKSESAVISIACPDPAFKKVYKDGEGFVSFSTTMGGFSFPFSNPVGTKSLKFGEILSRNMATTNYDGNVETGILATIEAAYGPVVDPYIENMSSGERFTILTSKLPGNIGFNLGDSFTINTNTGEKSVLHERNATATKVLRAVSPTSKWIRLLPGENVFAYSAASGEANMDVSFQFATKYDGV